MADARLGRYAQARQPGQEEAHHMLQVAIVQQGAWANPLPTFPLAAGYLKAGIDGDASLGRRVDVRIVNLPGGIGPRGAAAALLAEHWDVLAFSVLGWNARTFLELAATAKQVDPGTLVIFGGNHVSNQGGTVLAVHPAVDILGENLLRSHVSRFSFVGTWNGEGEAIG